MNILTLTSVRAGRRLLREEDAVRHEQKPEQGTHMTVMSEEAIKLLSLQKGDVVLDGTLGEGGHSAHILSSADVEVIGLDADPAAVAYASRRLAPYGGRIRIVEGNFANLGTILETISIPGIDKALFDLGWNRGQLSSSRGFSFLLNEPLNMSYSPVPASGFTAADILNSWSEEALSNVFYGYGEERYARRIAKTIVTTRHARPYVNTQELVEAVYASVPRSVHHQKIHPATKVFQALRIAVNDELGVLERGLRSAWSYLKPNGRIAVVTFHSVEDRIVKHLFKDFVQQGGISLTKKPLVPTREELLINGSARSAKLRGIQKI